MFEMNSSSGDNLRSNELQDVLYSPFSFIIKWGIVLAICFISVIITLSFFINVTKQYSVIADCTSFQKHAQAWVFEIDMTSEPNMDIIVGQSIQIEDLSENIKTYSGIIDSVNLDVEMSKIRITISVKSNSEEHILIANQKFRLYIINKKSIGNIIFESIKDVLR